MTVAAKRIDGRWEGDCSKNRAQSSIEFVDLMLQAFFGNDDRVITLNKCYLPFFDGRTLAMEFLQKSRLLARVRRDASLLSANPAVKRQRKVTVNFLH